MSTYTFEVGNDSIVVRTDVGNNPERPCATLLIIMLASMTMNALIIVTILRSSYRSYIYNILLLSLCLSLILEAGLNLIQASVIRASWSDLYQQLGFDSLRIFCNLNAASMHWPCVLQVHFLTLLSVHRSMVLGKPGKQALEENPKSRGFIIILRLIQLAWLCAPLLVIALAVGAIDSGHFQERYCCSPILVRSTVSIICASLLYFLGYLLPWMILLHFWTSLLLRVSKERQRLQSLELVALQRAAAQSSPLRGLGPSLGFSVPTWSQVWGSNDSTAGEGFRFFILTGLLTLFHMFLVVPHSIYVIVTSFYENYQAALQSKKFLMDTSPELPVELRPISTPWFDNIFTWSRFLYPMMAPATILIAHRDLRRNCLNLFNACRSKNHVHASGHSISGYLLTRKPQKRKRRSKFKTLDDVKTPVLFATGEGIYMRAAATPYTGLKSFRASWNKSGMVEPRFVSVFTDVSNKQSGSTVPKLMESSAVVTSSFANVIENLEDDDGRARTRKGGKSVRFSHRVSEIPLSDSGVWSNNGSESPVESAVVTVRPAPELRLAERKINRLQDRRSSDPFGTLTKSFNSKELKSPRQSLAHLVAETSSLTSSSSSLLLSLSQRMRNRNS